MKQLKIANLLLICVLINWTELGGAIFGINLKKLRKFFEKEPDLFDERPLSDTNVGFYKHRRGALSPEEKAFRKKARENGGPRAVKAPELEAIPDSFLEDVETDKNGIPLPAKKEEWEELSHFDARDKWPECASIKEIHEQGRCGSCWAVATAAVLSDRICIATRGKLQPRISAIDLARCCVDCHSKKHKGDGCQGGDPLTAFNWIAQNGVVSGGAYQSKIGCQPYPFEPSANPFDIKSGKCEKECKDSKDYHRDLYYTQPNHQIYSRAIVKSTNMMRELYNYGPITVDIKTTMGLYKYHFVEKSDKMGVYYVKQKEYAEIKGDHSVRLLGWGTDVDKKTGQKVPYWIIANSWGKGWGNQGTFKLLRGNNTLGVESAGAAGRYDPERTKLMRSKSWKKLKVSEENIVIV